MESQFYDDLTDVYHLIYADWEASIARQAEVLDGVLRSRWPGCHRLLDAACGIGTQALGLAATGYEVVASDLSPRAVERARREASDRGLEGIHFAVADLRELSTRQPSDFDVVLACDNAVPHLLSDEEIVQAFRQMRAVLRPGGGCVISVRNYAEVDRGASRMVPYGSRVSAEGRVHIFQIWDFLPRDLYDLSLFFVWERAEGPQVQVFRSRYYAVGLDRLAQLLEEAGFVKVERLDGQFFQPLLVGDNPTSG